MNNEEKTKLRQQESKARMERVLAGMAPIVPMKRARPQSKAHIKRRPDTPPARQMDRSRAKGADASNYIFYGSTGSKPKDEKIVVTDELPW